MIPLRWKPWVRRAHRSLSLVFTLFVLVNIALNLLSVVPEELLLWVGILTLIPLVLLMITGLYLFVLPYSARRTGDGTSVE